mmetsp:Transcript_21359/g.34199  ORF Transcript_21359/g.34199 Transcript_21359/m.34199 type:complete len:112 (+) Transcript_21359:92-427(+)
MANMGQVEHEIEELKKFIKRLGDKNDKGQYAVKFGTLFDDDEAQQVFEAIVGTLKAAKKRKVVNFKGQILLKGAHDDVMITLLKGNDDADENQDDKNKKEKEKDEANDEDK